MFAGIGEIGGGGALKQLVRREKVAAIFLVTIRGQADMKFRPAAALLPLPFEQPPARQVDRLGAGEDFHSAQKSPGTPEIEFRAARHLQRIEVHGGNPPVPGVLHEHADGGAGQLRIVAELRVVFIEQDHAVGGPGGPADQFRGDVGPGNILDQQLITGLRRRVEHAHEGGVAKPGAGLPDIRLHQHRDPAGAPGADASARPDEDAGGAALFEQAVFTELFDGPVGGAVAQAEFGGEAADGGEPAADAVLPGDDPAFNVFDQLTGERRNCFHGAALKIAVL